MLPHILTSRPYLKWIAILSLVISLTSCATPNRDISSTDPVLAQLQRDIGDYAVPFTLLLDPKYNSTAYAELETNRVYVSQQLLNDYHSGKYNYNHLLHIIGHEVGHLSNTGKDLARANDPGSEAFADFYGLLMLEEMQHDGFKVDLYDAIRRFLIRNGKDIPGGVHGDDSARYKALKDKLDYWARNAGRNSED